eukprot:TRINITY_DN8223_c0_g1_i1.p1 TRINITY_DN8223_c0_g1~~TRINITY_DN8223_c0_g1_i1.p1  ORF type:complete len:653 (+),score=153.38 TRINITY_DN8223_c0_g1_i1:329-2287(+)
MDTKHLVSVTLDGTSNHLAKAETTRPKHVHANPSVLAFRNVTWSTPGNNSKQVLHGISGQVNPGEVLAIMGPSGAGKTSLIQILCGRTAPDVGSEVTLNNRPMDKRGRRAISYVMQNDILLANLTVRETLRYAALLKLPQHYTREMKLARVEHVIDELGLRKAADTLIGNDIRRGVSGGEKKRVNVGVELMAEPAVMILDEPTSGLDSSTALGLVHMLRTLASTEQRTIVASLHQPSSQLFQQMDKLLLMTEGHTAYFGAANQALAHFDKAGIACHENYNPADFFLEVLTDTTLSSTVVKAWQQQQLEQHPASPRTISTTDQDDKAVVVVDVDATIRSSIDTSQQTEHVQSTVFDDIDDADRWPISWSEQTAILTSRAFKQSRGEFWSFVNFLQSVFISIVAATIWFQTPEKESRIQDRVGYSFFGVVYWGFQMLFLASQVFPPERSVLLKERAAGTYRLSAYIVAKTISELPLLLLMPTLYFLITYWAVGLEGGYRAIFAWMILILSSFAAHSIGFFIGATVMNGKRSATAASITMLTSMLLGGFYVSRLPKGLEWIDSLSIVKYGYHTMLALEFDQDGLFFECDVSPSAYEACEGITNESNVPRIPSRDILDQYDVDTNIGMNVLALVLFALVFRAMTYLSLKYLLFRAN